MAYLKQPKTEEEVKKLTVTNVKKAYNELATDYNRLIDLDYVYCPHCGDWKASSNFYTSNKTKSGLEHCACKSCLLDMATDYDKKTKIRTDNRDKTIQVFKMLDLPFIDSTYKSQLQLLADDVAEKQRSTAYQQMLVLIKSLPQYKNKTFNDSEFDVDSEQYSDTENTKVVQKTLKSARKRFGNSYNNEDLMFLENEYQDWITRYECNTKAQESIFERLSFKKWEINKATKSGAPTKDLDKTYQELLSTANITPRQAGSDNYTDAQTFGTLIQKYEETRPLPEIDPELEDVDKIGLYIDVFYKGHASKMLGLKNNFSHIYEKFMSKFTVTKPQYDDEEDSEDIFDRVFGNIEDDD